jgi:hypothetical protein
MRAGVAGLPETGETGRYLGVRPDVDIRVDEGGIVNPEMEGMSVVPPPVENLAEHRRPPEFGGGGKDPVYELETRELPNDLAYRPDPANPDGHGFIELTRRMPFEDYRRAIHGTRSLWRRLRQDVR